MKVAPIAISGGEESRRRGKDFALPSEENMEEGIGV